MPSRLSRKKSAPALPLCLSPMGADNRFESIHHKSTHFHVRKSRSAPSLATATKANLPYQEIPDESILAINFIKKTGSINSSTQQQLVDVPPSHPTSREPLKSLCSFSNRLTLSPSISSSTGLLVPSAAENTPGTASKEDMQPNNHPPQVAKRLSSRCLQALRKIRPRSVFYSDYRLSTSNTNGNRTQNIICHPSSSLPRQTPVFFATVGWSSKTKDYQALKSPKNQAVNSLDQESSLGTSGGCNYLLNEQKAASPGGQETVLKVRECLHNTCSRDEAQSSQYKPTGFASVAYTKSVTCPKDSSSDTGPNDHNCKKEDSGILKESHDVEIVETRLNPMEMKSSRDTETLLDFQEALSGLKPRNQRVVYKKSDENARIQKSKAEGSDCLQKESEGELGVSAFKRSRLAAWRHRKFDTPSWSRIKCEAQPEEREKEPASAPRMPSVINSEAAKVKKSPSLLFRFWDSMISETVSERNQTLHSDQQSIDAFTKTGLRDSSHPLKANCGSATRAKKGWGRDLQKAGKTASCKVIKDYPAEDRNVDFQHLRVDDIIAIDTPRPETSAGGMWERNKSRGSGEKFEQEVMPNQIKIDDSSESRKQKRYPVLSPDVIPLTHPKSPALVPAERLSISWSRSIQEYAGPVGHVRHSGQRAVSDTFRSGSSDFSRSGFTETGIPTLSCLKDKMGLGEEPLFEESSLAADWDVAMRMIEGFSRADHKLKRAGAIKLKRSKEGPGPTERSFANDSKMDPNGNRRTRPVQSTSEAPEGNESGDSSAATSLESLGYEGYKETNSV